MTPEEKINSFALKIQAGEIPPHRMIRQELLALCKEYAISKQPQKHQIQYSDNKEMRDEVRWMKIGFKHAVGIWKDNINKPL